MHYLYILSFLLEYIPATNFCSRIPFPTKPTIYTFFIFTLVLLFTFRLIYNIIQNTITIQIMTTFDENDEHFMQKLQQIVPELRKQIQSNIRSRLTMDLQRIKQQKREELNQLYQSKIKENIEQSNREIKYNLANMAQHIEQMKKNIHNRRPRKLTHQEEEQLIQVTVEQMIEDKNMLNQVKTRMAPRIQKRVREALEKQLEDGVEHMKKEMMNKLQEDRENWQEERVEYWKNQSEVQLNQLATEHSELSNKKQNMDSTLSSKRAQKRQAQERYQTITQKNELIMRLRAELKELKKMR